MDGYIELIESSGLLREDDVLVTVSTTHRVIRECFIWSQRKATGDHSNVHQEEQSLNKMDFWHSNKIHSYVQKHVKI